MPDNLWGDTVKDQTDIGGHGGGFPETRWTAIGDLQNGSGSVEAGTGQFLQAYWKPVYFFLRGKGYDNETAKDLTQGFFCDIVLGQKLLAGADRSKGRFRSLLLTSLRNYVVDGLRAGAAAKRRPAKSQFSLDAIDQGAFNLPDVEMGPDEAFSYAWASSLLDEVIARVEDGCLKDGKSIHWQVFRARVLRPILEGIDPVPLPELCGELKIANEGTASHMVATVKRRFQAELRSYVRSLVGTDAEIDQKIGDLMTILSTSRAR